MIEFQELFFSFFFFFSCNPSNNLPNNSHSLRWIKSKHLDSKTENSTRETCSMKSNIASSYLVSSYPNGCCILNAKNRQRGFPLIPLSGRWARVQNKAATRSSWLEGGKHSNCKMAVSLPPPLEGNVGGVGGTVGETEGGAVCGLQVRFRERIAYGSTLFTVVIKSGYVDRERREEGGGRRREREREIERNLAVSSSGWRKRGEGRRKKKERNWNER